MRLSTLLARKTQKKFLTRNKSAVFCVNYADIRAFYVVNWERNGYTNDKGSDYMTLGEKLRKIRVENDLTLYELAQIFNNRCGLNVSKGMISRWENGTEPNNTYLAAYAKTFGVDMNYLLGLIDDEEMQLRDVERKKKDDILVLARKLSEYDLTADEIEVLLGTIKKLSGKE